VWFNVHHVVNHVLLQDLLFLLLRTVIIDVKKSPVSSDINQVTKDVFFICAAQNTKDFCKAKRAVKKREKLYK